MKKYYYFAIFDPSIHYFVNLRGRYIRHVRYYDMDSSIKRYGRKTSKNRRDLEDMTYLYGVLNGHIDCPALLVPFGICYQIT